MNIKALACNFVFAHLQFFKYLLKTNKEEVIAQEVVSACKNDRINWGQSLIKIINKLFSYATISVYSKRNDQLIEGGLTDEHGKFSLKIKPFPSYAIIEYISYESLTIDPIEIDRDKIKAGDRKVDLGMIKLERSSELLDEIEIRAEVSEAHFRLDKTVFNVGKDLANTGGTAEEILDNVPSVSVDIDGNVSLRG